MPNLLKQEDTVSDVPVRRPPVEGRPLADDPPLALARLFGLCHARGRVLTAAHLEPLRDCIQAARVALDGLRFAAEDAVSLGPLMPMEAARADVQRFGPELADHLELAAAELDLLAGALREEARDAS